MDSYQDGKPTSLPEPLFERVTPDEFWSDNDRTPLDAPLPHGFGSLDVPVMHVTRLDSKNRPAFAPPTYEGDCGLDLSISEELMIGPGGTVNVATGVAVALPPRTFGWITGRSSTWSRHGLMVMPGIIDEGWRGELMMMVHRPISRKLNQIDERREGHGFPLVLPAGTRLAQLIVLPNLLSNLTVIDVEELPEGTRGEKGFGSSGN